MNYMKRISQLLFGVALLFSVVLPVSAFTLDSIGSSSTSGQTFTYWTYYGTNPAFIGTASPSAAILVKIDDQTYSVTAGTDGSWRYTPSELTGGTYAIDISGDGTNSTFTLFISTESATTKGGATVSATPTASVSATQLPVTGAFESTVMVVAAGMALIGGGVVLQAKKAEL